MTPLHPSSKPTRETRLGPEARHARAKLAYATRNGADPETIAALQREFIIARAMETIERAKAELVAVGHDIA